MDTNEKDFAGSIRAQIFAEIHGLRRECSVER